MTWPKGVGNPVPVNIVSGGCGGGAMTVADGADVAEGTTTDVAVVSDANGTLSVKLRGLVKIFADVWDSVNHRLKAGAVLGRDSKVRKIAIDTPGQSGVQVLRLLTQIRPLLQNGSTTGLLDDGFLN